MSRFDQAAGHATKAGFERGLASAGAQHQYIVMMCCNLRRQNLLGSAEVHLDSFVARVEFPHEPRQSFRSFNAGALFAPLALTVKNIQIGAAAKREEACRLKNPTCGNGVFVAGHVDRGCESRRIRP